MRNKSFSQYKISLKSIKFTFLIFTTLVCINLNSCSYNKSESKKRLLVDKVSSYEGKTGSIIKVKKDRIRDLSPASVEPMIPFERSHILHGAISGAERNSRYGDYLTVTWRGQGRGSAIVMLEYKQQNTGSVIKKKTVKVNRTKKRNITKLKVVGDEFISGGELAAWKIKVVENGSLTGTATSYLWD